MRLQQLLPPFEEAAVFGRHAVAGMFAGDEQETVGVDGGLVERCLRVQIAATDMPVGTSAQALEGQRDALAAADAQCDDATPAAVSLHGVHQSRGQNRTACSDRVAVSDGTP